MRIIFKDDRDSSIGRGCVLRPGHLYPRMTRILHTVEVTAPPTTSDAVIVTEGWRPARDNLRDLHNEDRAFDVSINNLLCVDALKETFAREWAARIQAKLGDNYDVVLHGRDLNRHIHIEYDPKGK